MSFGEYAGRREALLSRDRLEVDAKTVFPGAVWVPYFDGTSPRVWAFIGRYRVYARYYGGKYGPLYFKANEDGEWQQPEVIKRWLLSERDFITLCL